MRALIFGAGLIALSVAASSTAATPLKPAAPPHPQITSSPPDIGAMLAVFDKLFPPQPDPDPARLALAQSPAAAMWPTGAYGNLMTGMLGNIYDRVMTLKKSDLPGPMAKKATGAAEPSLHDQAIAKDPYFDQRSAAIRQAIVEQAGQVSAIIDPRIRTGLARSLARRFDQRQLAEINAFFATPTGHALAAQYIQLWVDPDMMRSLFTSMPEMMKLMPSMMQKVKAASDRFPAPPKAAKAKLVPPKH